MVHVNPGVSRLPPRARSVRQAEVWRQRSGVRWRAGPGGDGRAMRPPFPPDGVKTSKSPRCAGSGSTRAPNPPHASRDALAPMTQGQVRDNRGRALENALLTYVQSRGSAPAADHRRPRGDRRRARRVGVESRRTSPISTSTPPTGCATRCSVPSARSSSPARSRCCSDVSSATGLAEASRRRPGASVPAIWPGRSSSSSATSSASSRPR